MDNQLRTYLNSTFEKIDTRVIYILQQMILALFRERTVNLNKLSMYCHFKSKKEEARVRRLQRFIQNLPIKMEQIAQIILTFIQLPIPLAMDRTNWKFGKTDINILLISVLYKGYSFPLFWTLLPHKGNSSVPVRLSLLHNFIKCFGVARIESLVADREFFGKEWCLNLNKLGITYHLRSKNNISIGTVKGEIKNPKHLFGQLQPGQKIDLPGLRRVCKGVDAFKAYVSVCKSSDGELVLIISNREQEKALDQYKKRWGIETLFGCLKTRGFNFEDTHLRDLDRISNLLIVLSLTFFWAFRVGDWLNETVPIELKKHGRLACSLFRYGLNALVMGMDQFLNLLIAPLIQKNPKKPKKLLLIFLGLA
jgi:hypothetical protein